MMAVIRIEVLVYPEGRWVPLDLRYIKFSGVELVIGYEDFRFLVDGREVFSTLKDVKL
jgi:hypothetical protein